MIKTIFRKKKQIFLVGLLLKLTALIFLIIPSILQELQRFENKNDHVFSKQLHNNNIKVIEQKQIRDAHSEVYHYKEANLVNFKHTYHLSGRI
jgi:hypothetical protein